MRCSPRQGPTIYQAISSPPSDSASSMTADESTAGLLALSELGPLGASAQDHMKKCPHIMLCLAAPLAPVPPLFLPAEYPWSAGGNKRCRRTRAPCVLGSRRGTRAYSYEAL